MEVKQRSQEIIIRKLQEQDVDALVQIASRWVRSEGSILQDELDEIRRRLQNTANGDTEYTYVVATNREGKLIGMMGFRLPEQRMKMYQTRERSVEMVNAFVDPQAINMGVGTKLISALLEAAWKQGYEEVIWNSGPRYKNSAWHFYNRITIDRIDEDNNYYGLGSHAPVWRVQKEKVPCGC